MTFKKGTARTLRLITASVLAVLMVITTGAGTVKASASRQSYKWGQCYSHISIAVITEGNNKFTLAEKPEVKYSSDGKNWKSVNLGNEQGSIKNGREYQSGFNYSFTSDTVFLVTAVFTDGEKTVGPHEFTLTDIPDYKNSGKSFYEYCCLNYCDAGNGIDMKLTYEEIIDNFYDAIYNVDGDKTQIVDGTDYKTGDEVTVTDQVPEKEGYDFEGWKYGDIIYKAGDTVEMPEGGIEFVAQWSEADKYTVTFLDYDDSVISQEVLRRGEEASVPSVSREDFKTESEDKAAKWIKYEFAGWIPEGDYDIEDLYDVTKDMTFKASYTENEVKVRFYILNDGLSEPSELAHYPAYNYSQGIEGTVHYFREICNDDEAVKANIAFAPDGKTGESDTPLGVMSQKFRDYSTGEYINLDDNQYIRWYVIKEENDGWHVDGIVETKPVTECTTEEKTEPVTECTTEEKTEPVTECTTEEKTEPVTECTTEEKTEPVTECTTEEKTEPVTECTTEEKTEPVTECTTEEKTEPVTECTTEEKTEPVTECTTEEKTEPVTECTTEEKTEPVTECTTEEKTEPVTECTSKSENETCSHRKQQTECDKEDVETGDNGKMFLTICAVLMLASAATIVTIFVRKKENDIKNKE